MRLSVRFLTIRPGAAGALPKYFWQPSTALRAEGWRPERVPLNWSSFTDADALQAAAIARAQELTAHLDATRADAALKANRPAVPKPSRALGDMLAEWQTHKMFTRLAASTRRGYKQCVKKLETWGGDVPVRAIDAKRVQNLIASLSATPAFANATARVLQAAFKYGRLNGWVTVSPATEMDLHASEPSGLIWPPEVVAAFVDAADRMSLPGMGDAVLLNEWLGQRQGDIIRAPRTIYRKGNLVLRQHKSQREGKGGVAVTLPIDMVPHLRARLEAALLRGDALKPVPTTIIVSDETGLPFKPDNFRHVFARVREKLAVGDAELAIPKLASFEVDYLPPGRDMTDPDAFKIATGDLTFMHLRHTAVVRLAEAGEDLAGISSITGHSLASIPSILKRYMVRTAKLARGAFQKRMDAAGIKAGGQEKEVQG